MTLAILIIYNLIYIELLYLLKQWNQEKEQKLGKKVKYDEE